MHPPSRRFRVFFAVLSAVLPHVAFGTVLTFDSAPVFVNEKQIPHIYGDHVTGGGPELGFGHTYGTVHGVTPNVAVRYGSYTGFFDRGYGSLVNVIYGGQDRPQGEQPQPLQITLDADQGFKVRLHGFHLAGFMNPWFPAAATTVPAVRVRDENGTVLLESAPAHISNISRTQFQFSTPLIARSLTIEVEGGELWIGMDNIQFSQLASPNPVQAEFHVSPSGSDSSPGNATAPFRTLTKAQQAVRNINGDMSGDIVVVLHGGTYQLSAPLSFTSFDSGTNGFDVIYRAAGGEKPILSGGKEITGWTASTDPQAPVGTLEAPNTTGIPYTRQLYIDKVRRTRARGDTPDGMNFFLAAGYTTGSGSAARQMNTWRNHSGIEFVYTNDPSGGFAESHLCVESIGLDGTIRMKQPAWTNATRRAWDMMTSIAFPPAHIENAFELMDEPGEWYLDRSRGTSGAFYYLPHPAENLAKSKVIAPVLERLMEGIGTPESPIRNIRFEGIQFSYATWLQPGGNLGFPEVFVNTFNIDLKTGLPAPYIGGTQSNPYGDWEMVPGHIRFIHGHNLRFERCIFTHLGGVALELGRGSKFNEILGCVFYDISGNALQIGEIADARPADPRLIAFGNQVRNCYFSRAGEEFQGSVAIFAPWYQDLRIDQNQIVDLPYSGMVLGWGASWHHSVVPNVNRNLRVSNNRISDTMQVLHDGGGIYIQSWQGTSMADGAVVDGNIITGTQHEFFAMYTDQGGRFVTMRNNALYDNPGPPHAEWGGCASSQDTTPPNSAPYPHFPMGDCDFQFNYTEKAPLHWYCASTVPTNVIVANNVRITEESELPAYIRTGAGVTEEFRGILPHSQSVLPVALEVRPEQEVTLTFPTVFGWDYQILSSSEPGGPYLPVGAVNGTGSSFSWTDDGSATGEPPLQVLKRFYRINSSIP